MNRPHPISEAEALQSQATDLARELAERAQETPACQRGGRGEDLRDESAGLRLLIEATAAETGEAFLASFVAQLTSVLSVDYAVIAEVLDGTPQRVRALAVSAPGQPGDLFEHDVARTIFGKTLGEPFSSVEQGARALFPECPLLTDTRAEGYCTVPLKTKDGTVIGVLALLHRQPLDLRDRRPLLLELFAPRAAAELQRTRTDRKREHTLADVLNVMETVPDVLFTLDTGGGLVRWNRAVERVTGYKADELSGKSALDFVPPQEQEQTALAIRRALAEGWAELAGHLLTKDRRTIPYHWTGAALKDAQGRLIGISGVGRDVSEQTRAQEELERQRQDLVEAQALAHLGSWAWDIASGEVIWSDEHYRIFGYEPGTIAVAYETFLTALHPEDHDRVLQAVNDALAGTAPYDIECRIVRPSGDIRNLHCLGRVHRDRDGRPSRMEGTSLDITERKRTEEALRAGEERWQLAVRGSNDGIWDWNIRTGEVFFSARWKAMRGYGDHEMPNALDEWRSRIHPEDLDRVLRRIEAYLDRTSPEFCEEYRVQRKDGSYLWVLDRGVALWDDQGRPMRMAGSETDITARKRAEQALRESEERYRMLIDLSPSGIFVYADGKTVYVNQAACRILGAASPEEILGRPTLQFVHPDCHAAVLESARLLLEGGEPVRRTERKYVKLDGTVIDVEVEAAPIIWNGKRAIQGIFSDITARKAAEESLHRTTAILTALIQSSPVAIITSDIEGRLSSWNPAATRMFGWTESEVLGGQVPYIRPENEEEAEALWQLALSGGNMQGLELQRHRKDGSPIDIEFWGGALRDREGNVTGAFGVMADISERKRAEEALAHSERQLRTVLDTLPVGVCFTDAAGRVILSNPVSHRLWSDATHVGLQADGKLAAWWEHADGHSTPHRWALARVLTTGEASLNELMDIDCADGSRKTISNRAVPVRDAQGRITGAIVVNEDITERIAAEDALRRTHAFLQSIVENIPYMIAVKDAKELRYLMLNKAGEQLFGRPREEFIGKTAYQVLPEADADRVFAADTDALMPGGNVTLSEQTLLNQHRVPRVLQTKKIPIPGDDGRPAYLLTISEDITERRAAEEALRASEELFAKAFRASPNPIGITELATGRCLDANDAFLELFGFRREEVVGQSTLLLGMWPNPDDRGQLIERLQTSGPVRNMEMAFRTRSGELRHILVSSDLVELRGTRCLVTVGNDITERKKTESALRASEELFGKAFRSSPHPIMIAEVETGLIIEANDAAYDLFGYGPEDVAGRTTLEIGLWPSAEDRGRFLAELTAHGSVRNLEAGLRMKHGALRQCLLSAELIELHGRRCVVTVGTDITEQKRAEAALRDSEARLMEAQRIAHIGSWELNPLENRLTWSDEIFRIFEIDPQQFGASYDAFLALVHPDDRATVHRAYHDSLTHRQPYSLVHRLLMPDGRIKFVREQCETSYDASGRPLRSLGTVQDITEQKRAEDELQRRELELRQALEERERISQDLHDGILQSLYAVGLGLESCKPLIAQHKHKETAATVERAIARLNRVMKDIRNFIAGLESEVLQGGDLGAAVRTVVHTATQAHRIRCRVAIEREALSFIPMDRAIQVLHIVREALSNIVRHARATRVALSIRQAPHAIRLRIRDNGIGFDPAMATGTGHGLLNMAARARKLGTALSLRSAPGAGTTIMLDLPKEEWHAHGQDETHPPAAGRRS